MSTKQRLHQTACAHPLLISTLSLLKPHLPPPLCPACSYQPLLSASRGCHLSGHSSLLFPWRRAWQPTPLSLPGESHGQRKLAGCSPWDHKELNTTEATWLKTLVPSPFPGSPP